MRKKNKENDVVLKSPSLLKRTWKVWLYNLFWLALYTTLFFTCYTLDDLAFELDVLLGYGLVRPVQLVLVLTPFVFMVRHMLKTCNVIRYTLKASKHDKDVLKNGGSKRVYEGVEGTGKTLNMANDLVLLACDQNAELRLRYYLKCPFRKELLEDVDFNVLESSYKYFKAHNEHIPNLMANFDIEYQGKKQYPFDMAYIDQEKRLAEHFALGLTELANIMPNSWSKVPTNDEDDGLKRRVKSESLSLSRQYWRLKIVADEQRTGEIFLGFRSVISQNISLTDRRKVLNPKFLIIIQKILESFIYHKREKTKKGLSNAYKRLSNIIEDIGFYEFSYVEKTGIENTIKSEVKKFVIPCDIPFNYDTTGERHKYKLYNKKPE